MNRPLLQPHASRGLPSLGPLLLGAVCSTLCAGGCTSLYDPCFTPASEVASLQILAVRADPPDARLLADGSGPPISVRALVVGPMVASGDPIEVRAALCDPGQPASCKSPGAAAIPDQTGLTRFVVRAPAALISASERSDPLAGYGGVRVQLALEARTPSAEPLLATKLLLFGRAGDGRAQNHALEIPALRVRRFSHAYRDDFDPASPTDDEVLQAGQTLRVDVGDPVWFEPVLGPGPGAAAAQETYDAVDLAGRTVRLREEVSYSFYTTPHGVFSEATSSEPQPGVAPERGLTSFSYLRIGGGSGMVWIVARDSRGAQAWAAMPFTATDARGCWKNHFPCAALELACY